MKAKFIAALLGVGVLISGAFLYRSVPDSAVAVVRNRYETAQRETVLIVAPDGGQGTGIVVKRGDKIFVWTACHVVYGYDHADVKLVIRKDYRKVGTTTFTGKVLAVDQGVDVALLSVDAPVDYFTPATFDSAIPPRVGTEVYHVGNFLGIDFDNSVSTGVVSQIGVNPGPGWPWATTDQTTCALVPGSSGGPLFNADNDKVIGVVVGLVPNTHIFVYVPVRILEAWANVNGLAWAVRGDTSPLILPKYTPPQPPPSPLISIGEKKKK